MPEAAFTTRTSGGQATNQEPIAFTVDGVRFGCLPAPPATAFGALAALSPDRPGVSTAACVAFIAQCVDDPDLFEHWLAQAPADPAVLADVVTFIADAYAAAAAALVPANTPAPSRTDLGRLEQIVGTVGVGEIG